MTELEQARQQAQAAFDLLWQPGPARRTESRDKAAYWLRFAAGLAPLYSIDSLDLRSAQKVLRVCSEAHGGREI
jgi:hypothetical protein